MPVGRFLLSPVPQSVSVTWAAPSKEGVYTLTGQVDAFSGEMDLADNTRTALVTVQ